MTFEWSALMLGPEHDGSWANDCLFRVSNLLAKQPAGPGQVRLRWHVGGSFEEPDWEGLGRPRRTGASVVFHVGLPVGLQTVDLEGRILEYASEATLIASARCKEANVTFDEAGHLEAITRVREIVDSLDSAEGRRETYRAHDERYARRKAVRDAIAVSYPEPTPGPGQPRIEFDYSNQREIDVLFELETAVDEALQSAGLGSVDGNEVGEGTFTLFLDPVRGKRDMAIAVVESLASERSITVRRIRKR